MTVICSLSPIFTLSFAGLCAYLTLTNAFTLFSSTTFAGAAAFATLTVPVK